MGSRAQDFLAISSAGEGEVVRFLWNDEIKALEIWIEGVKVAVWSSSGGVPGGFVPTRRFQIPIIGNRGFTGVVGADWQVPGATDIDYHAVLTYDPAFAAPSVLLAPIVGLNENDHLTEVTVLGKMWAAGGRTSLTAELLRMTATETAISMAQVTQIVIDDLVLDYTTEAMAIVIPPYTVLPGDGFYVRLIGTCETGSSIDLTGLAITCTRD